MKEPDDTASLRRLLHDTVRLYAGTRRLCDQKDRIASLSDDVERLRHELRRSEAGKDRLKERLRRAVETVRFRSPGERHRTLNGPRPPKIPGRCAESPLGRTRLGRWHGVGNMHNCFLQDDPYGMILNPCSVDTGVGGITGLGIVPELNGHVPLPAKGRQRLPYIQHCKAVDLLDCPDVREIDANGFQAVV
ncbi:MAG: hypothetical protein F4Z65_03480 [Acidobacteria bacterium]|nr:hypothetical protein [Acidobacteriota bacterium]MYA45333.1 hypothetical protein [Acidobacteriota bacterium]MYI39094.1 hypothetical protein [Acidobacteriota bacterium]